MGAPRGRDQARLGGGIAQAVEPALMRHPGLAPQAAHQRHEFGGARVSLGLVRERVAIGLERVPARDDVDAQPPARQMVQRRRRGGELCRMPIAGTDRDQRAEPPRRRRQRGAHGEAVGPSPARAQQRPVPAIGLDRPGLGGQRGQAVVVGLRDVAAMPGHGLIGDVPEEFCSAGHDGLPVVGAGQRCWPHLRTVARSAVAKTRFSTARPITMTMTSPAKTWSV